MFLSNVANPVVSQSLTLRVATREAPWLFQDAPSDARQLCRQSLLQLLGLLWGLACHLDFLGEHVGYDSPRSLSQGRRAASACVHHLRSPNGVKHWGVFPQSRLEGTGRQVTDTAEWEDKRLEKDLCAMFLIGFSFLQFSPPVVLSLALGLDLDLKEKRLMRRREKLPAFFLVVELAVTLDKSSCDWLRPASFCLLLLRKMSLVPLRRKLTAETERKEMETTIVSCHDESRGQYRARLLSDEQQRPLPPRAEETHGRSANPSSQLQGKVYVQDRLQYQQAASLSMPSRVPSASPSFCRTMFSSQ